VCYEDLGNNLSACAFEKGQDRYGLDTLLGVLSASAFIIGFSGALMPGPVFVSVVLQVTRRGWTSGPLIVVGHGILEFALTIALVLGLSGFMRQVMVQLAISVVGGFFLLWMGIDLIRNVRHASLQVEPNQKQPRIVNMHPILTGLLASSANPYFYLWWATVGNLLTLDGLRISGLLGVAVFFVSHWMSDLSWYTFVSVSLSKGRKFMTDKTYRLLLGSCGLLVLVLGLWFIRTGMLLVYQQ
jgi:threonine/homoserine/homoserine lactone efflux protein